LPPPNLYADDLDPAGEGFKIELRINCALDSRSTVQREVTRRDGSTAWIDAAKRKLAALLRRIEAGEVSIENAEREAERGLTVSEFASEHYERRAALGVKHWKDEKRWFDRYIAPHLGGRPIAEVESNEVEDVLLAGVKAGRPEESVGKIRVEMFRIFRAARRAMLSRRARSTTRRPRRSRHGSAIA
jgi:hypothetical protein